jgi:hypothetical protein
LPRPFCRTRFSDLPRLGASKFLRPPVTDLATTSSAATEAERREFCRRLRDELVRRLGEPPGLITEAVDALTRWVPPDMNNRLPSGDEPWQQEQADRPRVVGETNDPPPPAGNP